MFNNIVQMNNFIKMDHVKLYNYHQSSKLTDLRITLNDGINSIYLKVHKLILGLAAPFFEKQFAFSTKDKIILNVDNAFIAYDLIMSFYNQKTNCGNLENWFHLLKTFQLRDYLGLQNDMDLLLNLRVPSTGFELFLEVCELIGFNEKIIKAIIKNLPDDYDCFKLSNDLLNEMIELENYYKVISGGSDGCVKIWNAKTGDLINTLNGHKSGVTSVAISFNYKLIASASLDHRIIVWNAETGESIHKLSINVSIILCVCFSPNDTLIASGNSDKTITIWNVETGKLINTLVGHNNFVRSVIFSPDNKFIVSGSDDRTIKIWDTINYQLINTFNDHTKYVFSISISSDSKKIVSGSGDGIIKIWNIENGQLIKSYVAHGSSILCVNISPNNNKIISSSHMTIKIWDANNYKLLHTLEKTNYTNDVKFSPNDKFIICGNDRNSILIWDAFTYQLINTIIAHNGHVKSVIFSNAGHTTLSKKLKKYIY